MGIKKPVLVLGFERSGTTLLRRLISMCPVLGYDLVHEGEKLLQYDIREVCECEYNMPVVQGGAATGAMASILAGEKIAYRANTGFVEKYIERWFDWWPGGIGFHIVRDGVEVARSAKRIFNRDYYKTKKLHEEMVPIVRGACAGLPVKEIAYAELVGDPVGVLEDIYKAIGCEVDALTMSSILGNKEPWMHDGRVMCGLRYRGKVDTR